MITWMRKLARSAGLAGIVAAGIYIALRLLWRQRTCRLALFASAVAAGIALVVSVGREPERRTLLGTLAPRFDIQDLGAPAEGFVVNALNDRSDAAGIMLLGEDSAHAAAWSRGRITDLGTLQGDLSVATGINVNGQIVGQSQSGGRTYSAFSWSSGRMRPLPSLNRGTSGATAINSIGLVVGFSTSNTAPITACRWERGRALPLVMPAGFKASIAEAVNAQGNAAGYAIDSSFEKGRAVLWQQRRSKTLPPLGGASCLATAISDSNLVGGASNYRGGSERDWKAVVWKNWQPRDLGRLPDSQYAVVTGINRSGDMVGISGTGCCNSRACAWLDGKLYDLNALIPRGSGWQLLAASAVNNRGQIVGTAIKANALHGFLLTPNGKGEESPPPPFRLRTAADRPSLSSALICWMTGVDRRFQPDSVLLQSSFEDPHWE